MASTIVPALRAPRQHAPRDTASAPRPVARSLPVPTLTTRRSLTTVYGLAVMDCRGRVTDRHLLRTLNWAPGAEDGTPLVAGKKVTGFANIEEAAVELVDVIPFLVEDELTKLGGDFSKGADWAPCVVRDGLLITGQNPASSGPAADVLIAKLGA